MKPTQPPWKEHRLLHLGEGDPPLQPSTSSEKVAKEQPEQLQGPRLGGLLKFLQSGLSVQKTAKNALESRRDATEKQGALKQHVEQLSPLELRVQRIIQETRRNALAVLALQQLTPQQRQKMYMDAVTHLTQLAKNRYNLTPQEYWRLISVDERGHEHGPELPFQFCRYHVCRAPGPRPLVIFVGGNREWLRDTTGVPVNPSTGQPHELTRGTAGLYDRLTGEEGGHFHALHMRIGDILSGDPSKGQVARALGTDVKTDPALHTHIAQAHFLNLMTDIASGCSPFGSVNEVIFVGSSYGTGLYTRLLNDPSLRKVMGNLRVLRTASIDGMHFNSYPPRATSEQPSQSPHLQFWQSDEDLTETLSGLVGSDLRNPRPHDIRIHMGLNQPQRKKGTLPPQHIKQAVDHRQALHPRSTLHNVKRGSELNQNLEKVYKQIFAFIVHGKKGYEEMRQQ